MATRVTIILDSGGFFTDESADQADQSYLDVGYFETGGNDIEVVEDGKPTQPPPDTHLGKNKDRIDVEHLAANGYVKTGVNLLPSFKRDILKKTDLFPKDTPDFDPLEYDCILRFQSGNFESSNVKDRVFNECRRSDDGATGNSKKTRPIANDVLVQYDLDKGEQLRLRRPDGTDVWSSSSVGSGTSHVEVKLLADDLLDLKYFKQALKLKGLHYFQPNPDPPPIAASGLLLAGTYVTGPSWYVCPYGDDAMLVSFKDPFKDLFCRKGHPGTVLILKP